jgi:hypothetical protein
MRPDRRLAQHLGELRRDLGRADRRRVVPPRRARAAAAITSS